MISRPTISARRLTSLWPELVFAVAFVLSFLLSESALPRFTADSGGYLPAGEPAGFAPTEDGGAVVIGAIGEVSLVGDSFRAWPVTLYYSLFPSGEAPLGNWGRVAVTGLLTIAVVIWLGWALARFVPSRWRWTPRSVLYLLVLTPAGLLFTFTIGAEGPVLLLVFATIALTLDLSRHVTPDASLGRVVVPLALVWLLALLALLARPSSLPLFLAAIAIGGSLLIVRRFPRGLWIRAVPALGAVALAFLSISYASFIQANQNDAWEGNSERAFRLFFALDPGFNPNHASELRESLPDDAPGCLRDYPRDEGLDTNQMQTYGVEVCGESGQAWIDENYFRLMFGYYASDPANALSYFTETAGFGGAQPETTGFVSLIPQAAEAAFFADAGGDRNAPLFFLVVAVLGGGLLGAAVAVQRRGHALENGVAKVGLLVLTGAIWLSFFLSFFDHPSDPIRKQWPFYPLAIVLGLTTLIVAVASLHHIGSGTGPDTRDEDPAAER